MVVLPNSSMWDYIPYIRMDTKSNRNDNVTLEIMDGKETTVAYLPKGCRKVRVEVIPYHVDRIVNSRARKPVIPLDAEILAIGIGSGFLEQYKKKYKVKYGSSRVNAAIKKGYTAIEGILVNE